jgi:hypothetical protein
MAPKERHSSPFLDERVEPDSTPPRGVPRPQPRNFSPPPPTVPRPGISEAVARELGAHDARIKVLEEDVEELQRLAEGTKNQRLADKDARIAELELGNKQQGDRRFNLMRDVLIAILGAGAAVAIAGIRDCAKEPKAASSPTQQVFVPPPAPATSAAAPK